MKKALLLSVIASTMIMAGGDIAPVEPVVEVEAPAPSGWAFTGQGVVYYQTADMWGAGDRSDSDLFSQGASSANAGVSLKAENKDIIGGIGAGVKLVGVGTLGLEEDVVSNVMETTDAGDLNGGAITELYLTYGIGNTLVKVGRQELPKALSPLAFSESWNVFANTYEAALVVNSDIPNTTLVGAWVRGNNTSNDLNNFVKANNSDGIFMITAANTSVPDVGITGTVYYAQDLLGDDLTAGWLDVSAKVSGLDVGFQAGVLDHADRTYAVGAKVGGAFGPVNAGLAVSYVNDEGLGVLNVGGDQYAVLADGLGDTGLKLGENALYTTSSLGTNPFATALDSTSVQLCASIDAAGGKVLFIGDYSNTGDMNALGDGDFMEATLGYATSIGNLDLLAGYVYQKIDADLDEDNNIIRAVARYNF